jgi:galactokinase
MAINRDIWIGLRARGDQRVVLYSSDFPNPADFSLQDITHSDGWADYVHGIAWTLTRDGYDLNGWEGVLLSEIPIGSGLSSSAALELAVLRAFWCVSRWEWSGIEMAKAARSMENLWLKLKSGIMDQMISACGEEGSALLIDCRDLSSESVPLPEGVTEVVMDTGVGRGLVESAYNERVEQCHQAAAHFGASSLRDVSLEMLADQSTGLDELLLRRANHVITENQRTLQAVAAMRDGDAPALGRLMDASHASLRDDYQVSSRELDIMVEIARKQPGCLGARMIGGGFGGCAIALVYSSYLNGFLQEVDQGYQKAAGLNGRFFPVLPSAGVDMVTLD